VTCETVVRSVVKGEVVTSTFADDGDLVTGAGVFLTGSFQTGPFVADGNLVPCALVVGAFLKGPVVVGALVVDGDLVTGAMVVGAFETGE
jgi:hypothetical protein